MSTIKAALVSVRDVVVYGDDCTEGWKVDVAPLCIVVRVQRVPSIKVQVEVVPKACTLICRNGYLVEDDARSATTANFPEHLVAFANRVLEKEVAP